ncbi:hypothetical protein [Sanguibacter suaedae]|uniref:Uncharacterized protein n=1 Tax=Sanguibacter suaedae TaxID=2795737 RepID=A0A934M9C0_9MICO|nr:hypothetical protein [Sanguibacter suaedae]MBI9114493.1 hypothetical protein [Sanguibacter suaedae]
MVTVPFEVTPRDESTTADRLSETIVATVKNVQAGSFGHSIPEGVTDAGVRINVESTAPIGTLAERQVEILTERLGRSIPLTVTTVVPPEPAPEPEPVEPPASEGTSAAAVRGPARPEPSPGLVAAPYVWDAEKEHLRAEVVYLGEEGADAQTQADVRRLVELTVADLASPTTQALVPPDASESFTVWLTVAVNEDAVGPLTEKLFEDGEDQFEDTRVDFVALTEPRTTIEEMLAGR